MMFELHREHFLMGFNIPKLSVVIIGEYLCARIDNFEYVGIVKTTFIVCFAKECLGSRVNSHGWLGTLRYSIGPPMNAQ